MAFLHAISIAAELSVHGMRTQTHAGALGRRQGLGSQGSGAAISPASLGQERRVKHTLKSWPGFGSFLPLFFAGYNGVVLVWEQRKRMG